MTLFVTLTVLMVIVALAILIPPLFLRTRGDGIDRRDQNITIARERMRELEQEHQQGEIDSESFERYRDELQLSLASDIAVTPDSSPTTEGKGYSWPSALVIALLTPLFSYGLYLWLGNISSVEPPPPPVETQVDADQIEQMVGKLSSRMEQNPDDFEGWMMLARSYMVMKRYDKALVALENLYRLNPKDVDVVLQYADTLALLQGRTMKGRPSELIAEAMQLDPNHPIAHWLSGMAAQELGELPRAIEHWKRAETLFGTDESSRQELRALIGRAEETLADPK